MRRAVWLLGSLAFSGSLGACASILGLDDGVPRGTDAGASDATLDVISKDGAPDVIADVVLDVPPDVPGPFSPLSCGKDTCNAVTQGCCRTGYDDAASPYSYVCVNDAGACTSTSAVFVGCDRAENCPAQGSPGHICCANVVIGNLASGVACVGPSACGPDAGVILCGPGDNELCMARGNACLPSTVTIVGWNICK